MPSPNLPERLVTVHSLSDGAANSGAAIEMSKPGKPGGRYYAGVIALVALGKFIFGVDFSMMNVALATISRDLHVPPVILPWIVSTYSLSYAGFLVLGGRAADTFGRRRFCIFGLCLFGIGLCVAISAANVWILIAARALEGVGSAFFIPASFSLMNVLLPEGPVRHRGFSVFGATQGLAMVLGLGGGGIVTTVLGWRSVFLISFPLVITAIVLAWRLIPAHEDSGEKHTLDVGGAVLITAVVVLALSALSAMGRYGWGSMLGLGLLGAAAVIFGAFLILERRVRQPLVPPSIYRYGNFIGSNLGNIAAMAATGGLFVLLNLFMQRMLHFSAMQSGLGMMPYAGAVIVTGHSLRPVMGRFSLRNAIVTGFTIFIAAPFLFAAASSDRGYAHNLIPGMLVAGLGSTLASVLLMALGTAAVDAPKQGVATGVLITCQQIGLALGVSVALTVLSASSGGGEPTITAFRHSFLATSAMVGAGLICMLLFTHRLAVRPGAADRAELAKPV
jgi:DHA2 family methylenomycin A resistance protein-like MFS transporter